MGRRARCLAPRPAPGARRPAAPAEAPRARRDPAVPDAPAPDDPDAWLDLAARLKAHGRFDEATAACARAIGLRPASAQAYRTLGDVFRLAGRTDLAVGACAAAVQLDPGDAGAHSRLANALSRARRFEESEAEHRIACDLAPRNAATLVNHGAMLGSVGRHREALALADAALALAPHRFEAVHNRAKALRGLGRLAEAIATARRAVALQPASAEARHDLACSLLGHGELTREAWDALESRHDLPGTTGRTVARPRWNGEDIAGRTILLHSDAGLGDALQFVRYVPLVAARGARVVLEVPAPLRRLLEGFPGVDRLVVQGDDLPLFDLPPFDLHCPLMSLPRAFATTLDTIPACVPFHGFLPTGTARAEPRDGRPLRVGLVWAGNPAFASDHLRSLTLADLAPLWDVPGLALSSLQMGPAAAQIADQPPSRPIADLMAGVVDYQDTAERIARLDLVVAVDTSVAHLAASLGTPVRMLSRNDGCWRWLQHRADTPWYPGMTIHRQCGQDWTRTLRTLCEDLRVLSHPASPPPR